MDEWTRNQPLRSDHARSARDDDDRADKHDRESRRKKSLDERLDKGLEESFPASDPVAVIEPLYSPYDRHRP
jgi:hypothetical protein